MKIYVVMTKEHAAENAKIEYTLVMHFILTDMMIDF